MTINLLIAEDQTMVLGALAALLGMESDFTVTGMAVNGRDALAQVIAQAPDIVLTDIEMPLMTGIELAQEISALNARTRGKTRVIIVTTFARSGYLRRALDAGVAGYLLKDAPAASLADAIRKVHGGGRAIAPELALDAWGEPDPLSERERQVLRLAADGGSSFDIARIACLSEGTGKLGAANRIDAARIARDKGWL